VRRLFLIALILTGVAAFVGFDVVGASVRSAREAVRTRITSAIPLRTQLAEAKAQVDAYAENVIRGEIAAENLADRISETAREVSLRKAGLERERSSLHALRSSLERDTARLVSDGPRQVSEEERAAMRRAREFQAAQTIAERRAKDLEGLRSDHAATLREIAAAKEQQTRMAEEVSVLEAEVVALEARESVAQTRAACRDASIDASGHGAAQQRLTSIRDRIKEKNRRLEYYAVRCDAGRAGDFGLGYGSGLEALNAVLSPNDAVVVPAPVPTPVTAVPAVAPR
jgi:hypothetical protein